VTVYSKQLSSQCNLSAQIEQMLDNKRIWHHYHHRCFKNQMSVIWSWTYFYNLHWNNYLYFKSLLYIWEEMIMMALLHMAGLENSECIWKIQRKLEVVISVSMTEKLTKRRSLNIFVQFVWEGPGSYIYMWLSKREISRECNDIIGLAKGSQNNVVSSTPRHEMSSNSQI
jgi:hypothetical protein